MSYSVVRRQGVEETSAGQLEAGSAVQLLKDWTRAYPQQLLLICDDAGSAVAYRRPAGAAATAG